MEQKKRIFGYDALKALAAFFVVLYHVGIVDLGYREGVYYYPTLVQMLWLFCACGVPLFYMVNGALTVSRNYDWPKTRVKFYRLLRAALFWSVVSMIVYEVCKQTTSSFTIRRLFYYWFLYSLAIIYLVNYLLGRLPRWCRHVVVIALLVVPFTTNLIWDVIILLHPEVEVPRWYHIGVFTMYGLVYLYLGDHLGHRRYSKWIALLSGVLGLALLALEAIAVVNYEHTQFEGGNYCFPTLGALLLSASLFIFIRDCDVKLTWLKRFITFLGNNALGIYILHLLLMVILNAVFILLDVSLGIDHPIEIILLAIFYVVLSAGLSELLKRTFLAPLLKL